MSPKSKKMLWIGVPLLIIVAAAASYKIWWYRVVKNVDITAPLQPTKQSEATNDHVLYLPRTETVSVASINATTKQIFLRTQGAVFLVDGNDGHIINTLTAKDYPELQFDSAVYYEGNYFITGPQVIERLDLNGKILNTYSSKNGLVDDFNLKLDPDPYAPHTVWVETFRGLSRLDTSNNKFTNYTTQFGLVGSEFNIRSVNLTIDSVWVEALAGANGAGGLARLDRATNKWQGFGPESFGKTGRIDFQSVFANDKYTLAQTGDSTILKYNKTDNSWTIIGSLQNVGYGQLYSENDSLYAVDYDNKIKMADLKQRVLAWKDVSLPLQQIVRDNANGLWIKSTDGSVSSLINGKAIGALKLPQIEQEGQLVGVSSSAVYQTVPGGFSRYNLTTGKRMTWIVDPTKQLSYSDHRVVVETNGYAYIIDGEYSGYGGGEYENLYRFKLDNEKGIESYAVPEQIAGSQHEIALTEDGTILINQTDIQKNPVKIFDWDKLTFVATSLPWQPEQLNSPDDPGNTDYSLLEFTYRGTHIKMEVPRNDSPKLKINAQRVNQAEIAAEIDLKPLAKYAFGGVESFGIQTVKFDDFEPNIVWVGTSNGLAKFNTQTGEHASFWQDHGSSFTGVLRIQTNKDNLILDDAHGIYVYPRSLLH